MPDIDLTEQSITTLQDQMASDLLSSYDLTEKYLQRIERIDQNGPALKAILELNPDALDIAAGLDAERITTGPRGPLHGIPILLKDNIDTADRLHTTAGSAALSAHIAPQDAFLVQKLRDAGAVILGKSNLSEWANFRSTRSTSGWSSLGGQTRNPYALDRNPCGSSSGSAVAVAANLCAAAVGTETNGSIICPSQANGIVGIKPTVGLISRSGIIPISHSQDTAGPMARTVKDAAILLGIMAGADTHDQASRAASIDSPIDYTQFLDPAGLRGARIGIARNFFGVDPHVDQIMSRCVETIRQQGAELIDPAIIEGTESLNNIKTHLLLYEFKAGLNEYLAALPPQAPIHSLAELVEFNRHNRAQIMPFFGQEQLLASLEKGPLTDLYYRKTRDACLRLSREVGIDATMSNHHLDAILAPSGGPAWLTDLINGDHYAGGCSSPAAIAGYPHITVPAGFVFGLPVGVSFFASAYQEPTLLKLAYAFEQATKVRRPPTFLPTADLTHALTLPR
jgi:amidase